MISFLLKSVWQNTFHLVLFFGFCFRKLKYQFVTLGLSKPDTTCFYFRHLFAYSRLGFCNACLGKMHNVRFPVGHLSLSLHLVPTKLWKRNTIYNTPERGQGHPWIILSIISEVLYFLYSFIFEFSGFCLYEVDRIYSFMWWVFFSTLT